jgi:hypothetical protein
VEFRSGYDAQLCLGLAIVPVEELVGEIVGSSEEKV